MHPLIDGVAFDRIPIFERHAKLGDPHGRAWIGAHPAAPGPEPHAIEFYRQHVGGCDLVDASIGAQRALDDNDAHRFFEALGDQVVTGPTLTNVNDFRAISIE